MGSTALNYINNFTVSNQGITDLRELLMLQVLKTGSLTEVLNMNYGVRNGKRIGGIGEFGLVGKNSPMCNPQFNNTNLATQEKVWELGNVSILERLCADDFVDTMVKFSMGTGNDKADLTGDDLMSIVIEPKLAEALEKTLWRVFWFGDKNAANIGAGGVITTGIDVDFFNMTDGLFKRLFTIAPTGSAQHVPIASNGNSTYQSQKNGLLLGTSDSATEIMDSLIYNADMRLRQSSDKFVLCTQSFADALAADIKRSNKGSDLQWESLFDGLVYATRYNGETVIALPMWDEMIRSFEDDGTRWNNPHRAVYASKSTLMAGTESSDLLGALKIWFSDDDQDVKIIARDDVGTMIWEDNLIMMAY